MADRVKFVTVDLGPDSSSIRVFDDRGHYIGNINHPGRKSAQSMGTQVVVEDGSNVTVYECSSGYPRHFSNRTKTR